MSDQKKREEPFINDLSLTIKQAFVVCGGTVTHDEKDYIMYYLAVRSYILKLRNKPGGDISTKKNE